MKNELISRDDQLNQDARMLAISGHTDGEIKKHIPKYVQVGK